MIPLNYHSIIYIKWSVIVFYDTFITILHVKLNQFDITFRTNCAVETGNLFGKFYI